eukprot:scaffold27960_cov112-Isochrysis_galbana.AAC.3
MSHVAHVVGPRGRPAASTRGSVVTNCELLVCALTKTKYPNIIVNCDYCAHRCHDCTVPRASHSAEWPTKPKLAMQV